MHRATVLARFIDNQACRLLQRSKPTNSEPRAGASLARRVERVAERLALGDMSADKCR